MKPDKKREAGIFKWLIIHLLLIMVLFSNLAPVIFNKIGLNQLAENLKIKEALAAVQYVGGASGTGTGATYSVSLTGLTGGVGSAAIAGDLVIVVTGWASAADGNPGVTTPTDYTEEYDLYKSDTRDVNVSVNWKIMGGTPDTSVTVSGFNNAANGGATVVHVWRGADQTTPMDVAPPVGVTAGNASSPNSPAITPITAGTYVLTVGMGTGDATPLTKTAPTGYGDAVSVAGTGSTMSAIANIASMAWSSGAEDPAAWTGGETSTSDSWAAGTLAIRPVETTPPTPDPMTFATTPTNDSPTQISATSTTGSDATTPINYFFTLDNTNCGADAGTGGNSSSWQAGVAYSDSGLQPNKCYGYTITARDSVSPTPNTGSTSTASSTYSSANTPGTPILSGATASTLNLTNAENSNPASNPTTNFAVQVITTSPNDTTWLNQWADATGNPSATAVWLTDAQLDALVLQGLQASTIYGVKVKARNQDTDETALSAEGQGTTLAPAGPDATSYTNTETALNYSACATTGCGGRISQTITISGTSLGSAVTNKDTCTAGASNGCVRIGNYTVPAASISTWNDTQIIFSVPSGVTVFGGSGTTCAAAGAGICVTQNGNNDAGGALEFWVFPNITSVSPSGAGEGKEGDTITITGTRFDTSVATGTVVFQNCGTADVSATVSSWSDTSAAVTVPSGIADNDDACDIKLTRAAGTGSKTASSTNFVVLPQIDSVAAIAANAGRTYDAGDTDGLIMLIGTHFGAAGSVTVLGSSGAQHATAEGQCSFGGWRATTTCREVPNAAGYTGNIVLTRTADSKSHTYAGTFRILPRITGITPGSGTFGDPFTLSGNHFCQNGGTCPSVFDASNKITFNGGATTTDFFAWTGASASSSVPSAASTGNVTITSNTYVSNGINFTVLSPTPNDPTNLNQYKDAGLTQAIAVGGTASVTPTYLTMTMQVGLSGGTLYPQVEVKAIGQSFACSGGGACGAAIEGIGQAGPGPVTGTTSTSTADNVYHWQARVRHYKSGSDYYSAWVSYPTPTPNSEGATDFQIDANSPTITFPGANTCADAATSTLSNSATISWNLNENGNGQVEYATTSDLSASTLVPVPPEASAGSHAISLSNLNSGTTYYFRVKSVDGAGNLSQRPAVSPFCSFTTLSVTDPGKTTLFYISGATGAVSSYASSSFLVHIPEAVYSVKSAFVELTGVTAGAGTNNVAVSVNSQATSTYAIAAGESFFRILYRVTGANLYLDPTSNVLAISPSISTNIFSAQIYVTYSFAP